MNYSVFIPVRKGSQRVKNKNTRLFASIEGGLLATKLQQLSKLKTAGEIIVSSNDDYCIEIADKFKRAIPNLKIIVRPETLGSSETPLINLIKHAGETCKLDHILWTHVTSPLCGISEYEKAVNIYFERIKQKQDSLISGKNFKEFLLDKKSFQLVNNSTEEEWPRTQDLDDLFEINNAIFLTSRKNFLSGRRTGKSPFLYEQDNITSVDVDNEDDFKLAEALYEKFNK